jgi:hypothetical protein
METHDIGQMPLVRYVCKKKCPAITFLKIACQKDWIELQLLLDQIQKLARIS